MCDLVAAESSGEISFRIQPNQELNDELMVETGNTVSEVEPAEMNEERVNTSNNAGDIDLRDSLATMTSVLKNVVDKLQSTKA